MSALCTQDLRVAMRRLRKGGLGTLASVVAMACGVGAAVAAWSLLSAVLLEPLAVAEPERLFVVEGGVPSPPRGGSLPAVHSYPSYETIRDSGAFDGIAAAGRVGLQMVAEQSAIPRQRSVYFASHDFFATLGVSPTLGRAFTENEAQSGAPVAVLSNRYWRSAFNADPAVLGQAVQVTEVPVTIIGVLPRAFRGLNLAESPDLYLPLNIIGEFASSDVLDHFGPGVAWIGIVGRLRTGDTPAAVAARLTALGDSEENRREYALTSVNTAAIPEAARTGMTQFTTLLSITVGLLLLMGCLTVGMLLLVRAEDRRDELAVCLALGAGRCRLALSIAVEAAVLCALGALLAVPVGLWLTFGLRAFELPGRLDIELLELSLSPGAWLMAAGSAFAAICAMALIAGFVGLHGNANAPRQSRTATTPRTTRRGARTALVAAQIAITLVLVTGAGLFARSLSAALSLNAAIETGRVVTAPLTLGSYGYTPERATAFIDELLERLRQNGSIAAAAAMRLDGGMGPGRSVTIDDVEREMPSFLARVAVDESYFSTVGLPITSGRAFTRNDTATSPPVVIVSESFGRLIADGAEPIGQRVTDWSSPAGEPPSAAEVIGVVPDVITDINTTEPLVMYHSLTQTAPLPTLLGQERAPAITLVFRAARHSSAAIREVGATIRAMDPQVMTGPALTFDEQIGQQMNPQRFGIFVLGALGGVALLLTVLGTYVIAESMVVRRRRELSVRAALGATGTHLCGLVLRDTAKLVGIGLIAGLGLAVLGARLIRALLYQVEPLDPTVLATVSAIILGLALIVSLRPALEVTRLDLTRAIREE